MRFEIALAFTDEEGTFCQFDRRSEDDDHYEFGFMIHQALEAIAVRPMAQLCTAITSETSQESFLDSEHKKVWLAAFEYLEALKKHDDELKKMVSQRASK